MSLADYQELQEIVSQLNHDVTVAELDGLVAGMLVRGPSLAVKQLMLAIKDYVDDGQNQQLDALQQGYLVQLVAALAEHAQELHALDEMEWQPLIPDDGCVLPEQVSGLAAWCAGFVHGCGLALGGDDGPMADADLPGNSQEMLADLADISRAESDELGGNEAENDFAEVLEYVRTAAFSCVLELSRWDGQSEQKPMAPEADSLQ